MHLRECCISSRGVLMWFLYLLFAHGGAVMMDVLNQKFGIATSSGPWAATQFGRMHWQLIPEQASGRIHAI